MASLNKCVFFHFSVKSQENGTSESSSPTQLTQQAQTKPQSNKEHTESKTNRNNKDSNSTNGQSSKKSKSDKNKQKSSNSINEIETETEAKAHSSTQNTFESDNHHSYLSNELDELESDRHSLLENHDLLDNSEHGLLDDDNTHSLLGDANDDVMMMLRHKEMFAGLVDANHLPPHAKSPLVNGYGILDRDTISYLGNDRQISQISQKMPLKELRREEMSRNEMLMRQNELLARQRSAMEHKHYLPAASIGLESASEMLGEFSYHTFKFKHYNVKRLAT